MRLYHLKIHPFAEQELKEARNWYNLQKENLGDEFFEAVEDKLYQITKNPNRFKKIRTDVRKAVLKRFPFSVIFTVVQDNIEVYAFFHHSRNPKVWKQRKK